MASYFNLTLDTIGPQSPSLIINSGAVKTSSTLVTLAITLEDADTTGYQMKIWGINGVATEGAASWETFQASKQVTLTSGDGVKTVYVKLRDDVWNESTQFSDTITLDTAVPAVTVLGPDYSKISKVGGKDTSTITFRADVPFVEYKVCVVPATSSLQTAGVTIGTTHGSTYTHGIGTFQAGTDLTSTIKGADLEDADGGDGTKIVKVFVKTELDVWSV